MIENITPETGISIGLLLTVVGGGGVTILGTAVALWVKLNKLEVAVENNVERTKALEGRFDGRMTHAEFRAWVREFRAANPGVKVPPFNDGEHDL